MTLHVIDATDDSCFARWFEVLQAAELFRERGPGPGWQPDEWRARAFDEFTPVHMLAWSDGGDYAAVSALRLTTLDNLHSVRCDLYVHPTLRRRGYGRALLEATERYAQDHGRREIIVSAMEGSHEVGAGANRFFAPVMGYDVGDDTRRLDISWPVPRPLRERLRKEWSPFALDYEILTWLRDTPEDLLAERSRLCGAMASSVPYLNLDSEQEVWSVDRVRTWEATTRAMGRLLMVAVARDVRRGELVAFSELTISETSTDTAYQWDTLVRPDHRGRRLGGLIKLANFDQLETTGLTPRRISTFNSVVNRPMISVNRTLGGVVTGGAVLWRKELLT
jgi:GNAT superfamily N-acetyltransferase